MSSDIKDILPPPPPRETFIGPRRDTSNFIEKGVEMIVEAIIEIVGTKMGDFIVEGAEIKCDKGSNPGSFTPTHAATTKRNGCVIGTKKDKVPGENIPSFGICSITHKPCEPDPIEWEETGPMKMKGEEALTVRSYILCSKGGKIDFVPSPPTDPGPDPPKPGPGGPYPGGGGGGAGWDDGTPSGKIKKMVQYVIDACNDPSVGYSQRNRWRNPDVDCSSLMYLAANAAGYHIRTGSGYTGTMCADFTNAGFTCRRFDGNLRNLKPGDIMLNVRCHTEMYIGGGKFGGAHSDENGGITGARGGDQGGEVSIGDAYIYPSGWDYVLVPPPDEGETA